MNLSVTKLVASERTSERMSAAERARTASRAETVNGRAVRVNEVEDDQMGKDSISYPFYP